MNTQSCDIASPPTQNAGPIERAGLTDTPVTLIPTRWIAASVRPIASPAKPGLDPGPVAPSTTVTKMNVITASKISAVVRE